MMARECSFRTMRTRGGRYITYVYDARTGARARADGRPIVTIGNTADQSYQRAARMAARAES